MNAKISVVIICVEAMIYLLLYNLYDCMKCFFLINRKPVNHKNMTSQFLEKMTCQNKVTGRIWNYLKLRKVIGKGRSQAVRNCLNSISKYIVHKCFRTAT